MPSSTSSALASTTSHSSSPNVNGSRPKTILITATKSTSSHPRISTSRTLVSSVRNQQSSRKRTTTTKMISNSSTNNDSTLVKQTKKKQQPRRRRRSQPKTHVDEGEHWVQKVVGMKPVKGRKGRVYKNWRAGFIYKVKWWYWPMNECTWEPYKHLRKCHAYIEEYLDERREKKAARARARALAAANRR